MSVRRYTEDLRVVAVRGRAVQDAAAVGGRLRRRRRARDARQVRPVPARAAPLLHRAGILTISYLSYGAK